MTDDEQLPKFSLNDFWVETIECYINRREETNKKQGVRVCNTHSGNLSLQIYAVLSQRQDKYSAHVTLTPDQCIALAYRLLQVKDKWR